MDCRIPRPSSQDGAETAGRVALRARAGPARTLPAAVFFSVSSYPLQFIGHPPPLFLSFSGPRSEFIGFFFSLFLPNCTVNVFPETAMAPPRGSPFFYIKSRSAIIPPPHRGLKVAPQG